MRVQYNFTSELDEVTERVKIHLEHFNNKTSLEKDFIKIIQILQEEPLNHLLFYDEVQKMRQNIVKLDHLLSESEQILSACQKIERGDIPTGAPPENDNPLPKTTSVSTDASEFQTALNDLSSITGALKGMKRKK